jgi:hypothetical protein
LSRFNEFLSILKSLLIQMPVLSIDSGDDEQHNPDELDEHANDEGSTRMQTDEAEHISVDATIVKEILRIFDSRQLCDKIENSLAELITRADEPGLKDLCLSVSYICSFVLLNTTVKIHKTLYVI